VAFRWEVGSRAVRGRRREVVDVVPGECPLACIKGEFGAGGLLEVVHGALLVSGRGVVDGPRIVAVVGP